MDRKKLQLIFILLIALNRFKLTESGVSCDQKLAKSNDEVAPLTENEENVNFSLTTRRPVPDSTEEPNEKRSYFGAQVWNIDYNEVVYEKFVAEPQVNVWKTNFNENKRPISFDAAIFPEYINAAEELLKAYNLTYRPMIKNLQRAIDEENPTEEEIVEFQNRDGRPITWHAYHRLNDIHRYLDYLALNNPDLCSTEVIGQSTQGRALKIIKISNGNSNNKAIWIDGGIHAREWISPATATYIINELVEDWDDLPEYIQNIDWYILPVTNPDGYEYSHESDRLWRKSRSKNTFPLCKGVDLNRNYGYKWGGKGVSKQPCSEIYGGTSAFSEPETGAIKTFLTPKASKIGGTISFHSYGEYILYPWGYDSYVPKDHQDLAKMANEGAQVGLSPSNPLKFLSLHLSYSQSSLFYFILSSLNPVLFSQSHSLPHY